MKKQREKLLSLAVALAMCLGPLPTVSQAAEITVTEVLEPKYDDMLTFSEGLAPVCLNIGGMKRWGYIDTTGREVIACKYDAVDDFSDGRARVTIGRQMIDSVVKSGYIDTTGREVIPVQYWILRDFSDGLTVAGGYDTVKRNYLDRNGSVVLACDYLNISDFSEGLAAVQGHDSNLYGYIDKTGQVVIPFEYNSARDFSNGLAAVWDGKGKWGFIDKTGQTVVPFKYIEYSYHGFSEGLLAVQDDSKKWGLMDNTGKEVMPCKYLGIGPFSEGLAAVTIELDYRGDGIYCYINTSGEEVLNLESKYKHVGDFHEGLAAVKDQNNKWGFIDKTGAEVIPCQYREVGDFSNGLATITQGDAFHPKWGYIDQEGNEVVPCKYEKVRDVSEGLAAVCLDGKWGVLAVSTGPAAPSPATAYASTQTVLVDGKSVTFNAYALKDENGNDTNYVKLRDVADVLNGSAAQFQVGWDGSISITTHAAYTSNGTEGQQTFSGDQDYAVNTSPVKVNGVDTGLEAITLTDPNGGGYTYFKLRDLGQALGFDVSWDADQGRILIDTTTPYQG